MIHCPHCETALDLLPDRASRVQCPACNQTFPHPEAEAPFGGIVLGIAVDAEERFQRKRSGAYTWLLLLGVPGVFLLCFFALAHVGKLLGDVLAVLVVVPLVSAVYGAGILLSRFAVGDAARFVGWVIVWAFVGLGGLIIVAVLILVAVNVTTALLA